MYAPAPPPSETALISVAQAGGISGREAKDHLVRIHMRGIEEVVSRWIRNRNEFDDGYQGGCLGFLRAIERFDPNAKTPLAVFARAYIKGGAIRTLRGDRAFKARSETLTELADAQLVHPSLGKDSVKHVRRFAAILPPCLRNLVRLLYWDNCSLAGAARQLGVSRVTAYRWLEKVRTLGRTALTDLGRDLVA